LIKKIEKQKEIAGIEMIEDIIIEEAKDIYEKAYQNWNKIIKKVKSTIKKKYYTITIVNSQMKS